MSRKRIAELRKFQRLAEQGGGVKRLQRQHDQGKLSARERIASLVDPGTFVELDAFVTHRCSDFGLADDKPLGDGVVSGHALVHGNPVAVFAQDFTVLGGSLSYTNAQKILKVMDLAERIGCPIIGINDSGGARIQEGVESLAGYAEIFLRNVQLSGVVPQISVVLGPCAGGAVYSPALTDFIFMVDGISHMFITGPDVIKAVTKETVSKEDLGGAHTHNERSGVAHFLLESEELCFQAVRELLTYLPQSNRAPLAPTSCNDDAERANAELNSLVPENPHEPYDMHALIEAIVDDGSFLEVQERFAQNIIVGFCRLNGQSVGVVANQPNILAGCLDIDASTKAARFVRFCDAFHIPLVTVVDVPGFLPGTKQEFGGIIRHGAKLLYAFAEATVPRITVITRKAYGGAYDVMNSKHIRADFNFAYPTAEIAVMGPEGAVNIIARSELKTASAKERQKLVDDYRQQFANPWRAANLGFIDDVIEPAQTRRHLTRALHCLKDKRVTPLRKKHGNIPL